MKKKDHLDLDREELEALSKAELIKIILDQREMFYARIDEKEKRINELTEQLAGLNRQRDEQKNKEINDRRWKTKTHVLCAENFVLLRW